MNTLKSKILSLLLAVVMVFAIVPLTAINVNADDVLISSVEVTQIMGKGIDLDSGKYYFMNMFVAGKPTAIQVVMTEETKIDSASLEIYYEGVLLTVVKPTDKGERQIFSFIPPKSEVNEWKAGRYKFTVNINDESKTTEAIFNDSRTFSVLVISASVKYGGKVYDAPEVDADTIPLRAQAIPVSESKLVAKYRNAAISFGTGSNGYDISNPEGHMSFLADIDKYRLKSAANYDAVVAVVAAPLGEASGYTDSEHAIVITLNDSPDKEELCSTLLHELGHIFGNGDEYTGGSFSINVNGAPYGIKGTDNGKSVTGNRAHLKGVENNDYSGILIHDVQNPYNPKAQTTMLERSSFMGSSYKHWPTSMVWEEAYKHLIPNYQNVLPRVYTDGTIVAKRPNANDLSNATEKELKDQFRAMLNEVRVASGYEPYKEDQILIAGDKLLREVAEEALRSRNFGSIINIKPMQNSLRADTKHLFTMMQGETTLDEYKSTTLESKKDFFIDHPCGQEWIERDYIFLAFVRADNVIYYMWSTVSGAYPDTDGEEYEPQPETPPIPEVNPVTDELIDPEDYINNNGNNNNNNTTTTAGDNNNNGGGNNAYDPDEDDEMDDDEYGDYKDLTKAQRLELLTYDSWDVGNPWRPVTADYIYGFLAWYANDQYGLNITADDVENAVREVSHAANYDGVGEHPLAGYSRFYHVCAYYKLYPTQEMREGEYIYLDLKYPNFGDNPKRAKGDTDSLDAYFASADFYPDYADLTGEQQLEMLGFGWQNETWLSSYDDPYDYIYGYYALYVNDRYGLNVTKNELLALKDNGYEYAYYFEEVLIEYGLYPSMKLREKYPDGFNRQYSRYGENPKRAKDDTDSLDYYFAQMNNNDSDIKDPDGEW